MATWSAWKSIGSKSYVFETTVSSLFGSTTLTLGTAYTFTHNLGLSSPGDYVCVIDIEVGGNTFSLLIYDSIGDMLIGEIESSTVYHLLGINTGGYKNGVNDGSDYITWVISVTANQISFTLSATAGQKIGFGSVYSDYPVKIYLFKP